MHQYSIDSKKRDNVLYFLVIISICLSMLLRVCLSKAFEWISCTLRQSPGLRSISDLLKSTDIIPNIIGVPIIFWLLSLLFDKVLWKFKWINVFLGVPDLNGTWKGELHSSYDDDTYNMTLEISQTWTKIQCTSIFEKSSSYSNVAAIYRKDSKGGVLYFGFRNQSSDITNGNQQYDGYNILVLQDDTLDGKYFNDRPRPSQRTKKGGNIGTINLKKIDKTTS